MKIDLTPYNHLNQHLLERVHNHRWLNPCLEGKAQSFPYRLDSKKSGSVDDKYHYAPRNLPNEWPDCEGVEDPTYLLNIPTTAKCASILSLIQREAFGVRRAESKTQVQERVAVVIGMNRAHSLDPRKDASFLDEVTSLERVEQIAYRIFGFFWTPVWKATGGSHLYTPSKGYLLLKALSPQNASAVLDLVESSDSLRPQIPFQQIREEIKESAESRAFMSHFQNEAKDSFTYFGLMDDDSISLREERGLLSLIDEVVTDQDAPSVITCGYRVEDVERPILALSVKLDMAVRAAMNSEIPFSAYFPEPGSFFCVRRPPGLHFLSGLSFLGDGAALESRRLIQNARRARLFDDRAVFLPRGGLQTTVPDRMKTLKNAGLGLHQIKQKGFLTSLRAASQTHATPKQWADNLYIALKFKASQVTDVTGPCMRIFNVFDPLSRMFAPTARFNAKRFDETLAAYHRPLSAVQKSSLKSERAKLIKLGMKKEEVDRIVGAARASGQAMHRVLREAAA